MWLRRYNNMASKEVQTLVIDNFFGSMTAYRDGDINSGRSNVYEVYGNNPFTLPGNLTWNDNPVQIDAAGDVITDLIMAGKERVESGVLYVYAIGHTGRLYKIQVNDPNTFNPDYDNPVLLTTLSINSPTFTRGGFMDFYGATEKIYISHDKGVTSVNFDGSGEAFVGVMGSWTQDVPHPFEQFIGSLFVGNGSNIAEIDETATVITYTKLSPGFPTNSQVRDMDINADGTYLQITVSRVALGDITSTSPDIQSTASSESYIFSWNGTDEGYTTYNIFPTFSLTANTTFRGFQYYFGMDQYGMAIFSPMEGKLITEPETQPVLPNAISSTGNLLSWIAPYYFEGNMEILSNLFGTFDWEVGLGYWTSFVMAASGDETDIQRVPCQILVSNFGLGPTSNGYSQGIYGTGKVYFSTLETSDAPTTAYRFYKWAPLSTDYVTSSGTPIQGVYQTQQQIFSKKMEMKEVRVYGEPWVAGVSFQIDLIGSDGNPISGASKTFTVGTNLTAGDDYAWYNPDCVPTYTVGLRVTNLGTTNHVIEKCEIDYALGGK